MTCSLDTNLCIRIINGRATAARTKLLTIPASEVIVCSIVRAELFYGAAKSRLPAATRQQQEAFLAPFKTLPFDDAAASSYAQVRADLERSGQLIGPLDMQIAAIALAHDLTLITHNVREFSRVKGLGIEDWELT